jgi:hypothetical protein
MIFNKHNENNHSVAFIGNILCVGYRKKLQYTRDPCLDTIEIQFREKQNNLYGISEAEKDRQPVHCTVGRYDTDDVNKPSSVNVSQST